MNNHVIQLDPERFDLITVILGTKGQVERVFPREKWKHPGGVPLGDTTYTPVLVEIPGNYYCDGDSPYVQLCIGVTNAGQTTLIAHSTNDNPDRSFIEFWPDRRDLSGKFELDGDDDSCTFEFRRAIRTEHDTLIPVDEHGKPMRDAPGKYDRAARAMGAATEHMPFTEAQPVYDISIKPISQKGQVLLLVNRTPSKDKHEYVSVQLPEEFAKYIVGLHEAAKQKG